MAVAKRQRKENRLRKGNRGKFARLVSEAQVKEMSTLPA